MRLPSQIVIERRNWVCNFLMVVVSTIVITAIIWIYLDRSQWSYITMNLAKVNEGNKLLEENKRLYQEIVKLQEHVTMLDSKMHLETRTIEHLQQDMIEQQELKYKLKNELAFYQSIMGYNNQTNGLQIQGLLITKSSRPSSYIFQVILAYISSSDKIAKGKLSITFQGILRGAVKKLDIQDVALSDTLSLDFDFENFQSLMGGIMLPQDFIVSHVVIHAHVKQNKKIVTIQRVFDWLEVLVSE